MTDCTITKHSGLVLSHTWSCWFVWHRQTMAQEAKRTWDTQSLCSSWKLFHGFSFFVVWVCAKVSMFLQGRAACVCTYPKGCICWILNFLTANEIQHSINVKTEGKRKRAFSLQFCARRPHANPARAPFQHSFLCLVSPFQQLSPPSPPLFPFYFHETFCKYRCGPNGAKIKAWGKKVVCVQRMQDSIKNNQRKKCALQKGVTQLFVFG